MWTIHLEPSKTQLLCARVMNGHCVSRLPEKWKTLALVTESLLKLQTVIDGEKSREVAGDKTTYNNILAKVDSLCSTRITDAAGVLQRFAECRGSVGTLHDWARHMDEVLAMRKMCTEYTTNNSVRLVGDTSQTVNVRAHYIMLAAVDQVLVMLVENALRVPNTVDSIQLAMMSHQVHQIHANNIYNSISLDPGVYEVVSTRLRRLMAIYAAHNPQNDTETFGVRHHSAAGRGSRWRSVVEALSVHMFANSLCSSTHHINFDVNTRYDGRLARSQTVSLPEKVYPQRVQDCDLLMTKLYADHQNKIISIEVLKYCMSCVKRACEQESSVSASDSNEMLCIFEPALRPLVRHVLLGERSTVPGEFEARLDFLTGNTPCTDYMATAKSQLHLRMLIMG